MSLALRVITMVMMTSGCVDESSFDETGVWVFDVEWGFGSCGTVRLPVGPVHVGVDGIRTDRPHEAVTGTATPSGASARMTIAIVNSDVTGDGGSTSARFAVTAVATDDQGIVGWGTMTISGAKTCDQSFGLTGHLDR